MKFSTFQGPHLVVMVVLHVALERRCQLWVFLVDLVNELRYLLPLGVSQSSRCLLLPRYRSTGVGSRSLSSVHDLVCTHYLYGHLRTKCGRILMRESVCIVPVRR